MKRSACWWPRASRPWRRSQFVREFKRAGGLIAAGSDAANQLLVPGLSLHEEIGLLVAAGFTPVEAISDRARVQARRGPDRGGIGRRQPAARAGPLAP